MQLNFKVQNSITLVSQNSVIKLYFEIFIEYLELEEAKFSEVISKKSGFANEPGGISDNNAEWQLTEHIMLDHSYERV